MNIPAKEDEISPMDTKEPVVRSFLFGIGKMWIVIPAAFLTSLGIGIASLGLIFFIKNVYGAGPQVAGLFGSTWSVFYFLGCFILRPIGMKILPRWSMLAATVAMSLSVGLILLIPGLPAIFILFALFGFSSALFWPPIMGWLSQGMEGTSLSKSTSRFNVSWSIGAVISPYLGGFLAELNSALPIVVSSSIFLACAIFILVASLTLPNVKKDAHRTSPAGKAEGTDASTRLRFATWIGVFCVYALMGILFNVFPVFAKDILHLSESGTGFILFLRALLTLAGFTLLGRFHFWHFKVGFVYGSQVALIILCFAMGFLHDAITLTVAISLAGIILALTYTNSIFHGASGARDREKRMTIHETVLTAGQIFGSLLGGFLNQNVSMAAAFWALGGLFTIALAAQAWTQKKR